MQNNVNFQIVKLPVSEWQAFKELRLKALKTSRTSFGSTFEREVTFPDEKWKEKLESSVIEERSLMLFAKTDNNKLIGMIGSYWNPDKPEEANVVHIWGVYVDEDYRGNGVGHRLFDELLTTIRAKHGLEKATLTCNINNTGAQKLYAKEGFVKIGEIKEGLKAGDDSYDEVVMELNLH